MPAHIGQREPFARELTADCHSWPRGQRHHTLRPEPSVTSDAVKSPLSVGCHSVATCGRSTASEFTEALFVTPPFSRNVPIPRSPALTRGPTPIPASQGEGRAGPGGHYTDSIFSTCTPAVAFRFARQTFQSSPP